MRTNLVQFMEARVEQAMAQAFTRSFAQVNQTPPPIAYDLVAQLEGRILGRVQQMLSEAKKRQLAGVRQMVQQVTPPVMPSYPIAPDRSEQIQQLQQQTELLAQEMVNRKGEISNLHQGILGMARQQECVSAKLGELGGLQAKVDFLDRKLEVQPPPDLN